MGDAERPELSCKPEGSRRFLEKINNRKDDLVSFNDLLSVVAPSSTTGRPTTDGYLHLLMPVAPPNCASRDNAYDEQLLSALLTRTRPNTSKKR